MCFTMQHGHRRPVRAADDINVYKTMEVYLTKGGQVTLRSPIMEYVYARGNLKHLKDLLRNIREVKEIHEEWPDHDGYAVKTGFHAHTDLGKVLYICNTEYAIKESVTNGFTSIVLCAVIPKGSLYLIDPVNREIVSNQIRLIDCIFTLETRRLRALSLTELLMDVYKRFI